MAGPRRPILQVHPTRLCNLRCLHCYSASGPEQSEELAASLLTDAIGDAAALGYEVLAVSGGEPLVYRPLPELLRRARGFDMTTTITTNGMFLTDRQLDRLDGLVDLVAVSLDGKPDSHDRMRASPGAFARMRRHLPALRRRGWRFGFLFTLTQHNLDELDWVWRFAHDEGASLLQVHPLEAVGRAALTLPDSVPDERELLHAAIEWLRLQREGGGPLVIHLDVADRRYLMDGEIEAGARFADVVNPLVIEADGTVVPIQHGMARRYALGSLHRARLRDLADAWLPTGRPALAEVCRRVHERLASETAPAFFDWYAAIGAEAAAIR